MSESVQLADRILSEMRSHGERFTEYVNCLFERSDKTKIQELASLRRFSPETLAAQKVFYVPKTAAMLMIPKFLNELRSFGVISDKNLPVFYDRWVFPIFNTRGHVVNLVGYSPTANERYLYGRTPYYDRKNTLYGLETLHLVQELGYAIIVEGITDAVRLRDMGYLNAYAMCGTGDSPFNYGQINRRITKGVICIPDRDAPGQKARKNWKFENAITLWVDPQFKDVDEMCRKHPDGISAVNRALQRIISMYDTGEISRDAFTVRVSTLEAND